MKEEGRSAFGHADVWIVRVNGIQSENDIERTPHLT